jgi:Tfp pilus assembly protein PilX
MSGSGLELSNRTEAEYRASKAQIGMSDDQLANERDAQRAIKAAKTIMRDAIRQVNAMSSIAHIPMTAWDDFLHDNVLDEKTWNEGIEQARNA